MAGKRGAILPTVGKTRITIYLDNTIVERFKSLSRKSGKGYQTLINDALAAHTGIAEPLLTPQKEVIAWQVAQTMKRQKLTKAGMAVLMGTSRAQLDRLLDPQRDVTLSTLSRAATALGRQLRVTLV